jgi:hypothetical protein
MSVSADGGIRKQHAEAREIPENAFPMRSVHFWLIMIDYQMGCVIIRRHFNACNAGV